MKRILLLAVLVMIILALAGIFPGGLQIFLGTLVVPIVGWAFSHLLWEKLKGPLEKHLSGLWTPGARRLLRMLLVLCIVLPVVFSYLLITDTTQLAIGSVQARKSLDGEVASVVVSNTETRADVTQQVGASVIMNQPFFREVQSSPGVWLSLNDSDPARQKVAIGMGQTRELQFVEFRGGRYFFMGNGPEELKLGDWIVVITIIATSGAKAERTFTMNLGRDGWTTRERKGVAEEAKVFFLRLLERFAGLSHAKE